MNGKRGDVEYGVLLSDASTATCGPDLVYPAGLATPAAAFAEAARIRRAQPGCKTAVCVRGKDGRWRGFMQPHLSPVDMLRRWSA